MQVCFLISVFEGCKELSSFDRTMIMLADVFDIFATMCGISTNIHIGVDFSLRYIRPAMKNLPVSIYFLNIISVQYYKSTA